ncbi:hypothetical protein XBFM1_990003 [Xenorhabdus bovienii str. feltiae Moldova]|uniref:Uncharacterized protein n=1 Tax=Xenorhabdus bovienii str. feltiae Moldova TaxID=1398200 RepID=A0A077P037_XENBV|nr:hypothetical protein XBFM1_990003 [Xenorhabdus bovienii str. feltiae Moldova]
MRFFHERIIKHTKKENEERLLQAHPRTGKLSIRNAKEK